MDLKKAIKLLEKEYEKAQRLVLMYGPCARDACRYALHKVCRMADEEYMRREMYSRDEMGRMIKNEKEMPSDLEMAEHWRKKYEEARLEQHRLELKIRYELGDSETKIDEISLNGVRNRAIGEFATRLKKLTMITEYDIDMLVEEMCGQALD